MSRANLPRNVLLFLAWSAWAFLLLSLGSFQPTDWPSHAVEPYPPVANLCGAAGALVAYYAYLAIGQGVFPVLFFIGAALVLKLCRGRIGDYWMRVVGLILLAIAFAAAVHQAGAGSPDGLPEGRGGVIGIGAGNFLHQYFNTAGTWLVLLTATLIGVLLAADDLILRAPGLFSQAVVTVRNKTPQIQWNFPALPKLPAMPGFVTRDAIAAKAMLGTSGKKPIVIDPRAPKSADSSAASVDKSSWLRPWTKMGSSRQVAAEAVVATLNNVNPDEIDEVIHEGGAEMLNLSYREDDAHDHAPAADVAAYTDDADPHPAGPAVIPPPEQRAPVQPSIVFRSAATRNAPAAAAPAVRETAGDDIDASVQAATGVDEAPPAPEAPAIRKDIVVKLPTLLKPRQSAPVPPKELGEYHLPGWDCLEDAEHGYVESQETFVREQAALLEQALREFAIDARVTEIDTGPVITMYEIALAPGIKVSTISALSNDIQRSLKAETVRIVAPIPGKNTVGIEVPNEQKEKVRFKDLMQLAPDHTAKSEIPLYLGKDASGEPLIYDLAKMPHCLIAGTTGSGKSVCINTIIMSILYKQRPDLVKLILFDPKVVEMAMYKDIPHLMCPVINDAAKATSVLDWACEKMDERYEVLAEAGVRNIAGYNKLTQDELFDRFKPDTPEEEARIPKKLPYIVIIIDELADLMMTSGKEVEMHIVRLAQKARAVGIHLILATQRPSANVVTGLIKSNMPSRIAFRVASKMDSRIVLDQNGADLLLGHGDMLFLPPGASKPTRAQGTFIDDKEVRDSVKLVKAMAEAQYEPELVQIKSAGNVDEEAAKDELFDDAVRVVLETKRGSVSLLQRRLTIGYSRASRLIEAMAAANILGTYKGSQAREVNITVEEWEAMIAARQQDAESGMTV